MLRAVIRQIIVLLLLSSPALAQQEGLHDDLLDRLAGDWVMRGTIAGAETTHDIKAELVLRQYYLMIHEVSREKTENGTPEYEAIVMIGRDPLSDGYACLWLDSTGGTGLDGRALGHAMRDGDALPFVFEVPGGGRIHNTFTYDRESDTWKWAIDIEDEEGLRSFARVTLTRK